MRFFPYVLNAAAPFLTVGWTVALVWFLRGLIYGRVGYSSVIRSVASGSFGELLLS